MKRILLICSMAILSFGYSFAQTTDAKLVFASETSSFEANTSRNRADLYQSAYDKLTGMMKDQIAKNKTALQNLAGNDKKNMQAKIDNQEHYYGEIKAMSADMVKNRVAIKTKLDSFQQTL